MKRSSTDDHGAPTPKRAKSTGIGCPIGRFELERYFALYEFSAKHLLCCSDCEPLPVSDVVAMADATTRKMWDGLTLHYTESEGHPLLRAEIALMYEGLSADDITLVAPEEGIYIAMQILLRQGDEVIVQKPGYQSLAEIATSKGCAVIPWEVRDDDAGWHFNIDELRSLVTSSTKLIVVNAPHNPTGATFTAAEYSEILDMASAVGAYVFSDEMYRYLEHDPASRLPSACCLSASAVSLSGMSKTFAMPGLRIGWLATRDKDLTEAIRQYKDYTTICSSAPSEILALIGLRAADKIVKRNLEIITRNCEAAEEFFARHADLFVWHRPQQGSMAFVKMKDNQWFPSVDLMCTHLVKDFGVMLLPSTTYRWTGPQAVR